MKPSSDTPTCSAAGEKPKTKIHGFGAEALRWVRSFLCHPIAECLAVVVLCGLALVYLPIDILRGTPASGGDTGSHYWPLYTLIKFAIPNFTYPVLNPGNNLGEPQLVHYFPTPFFIMAALVPFVGTIGRAFNIGTMIPIVVFPACVYLFCILSWMPRRVGVCAAAFSLFTLYNEAFSMWGGNTLSLLAGQFAHQYSLCFFLIAAGQFNREIGDRRPHILSSILFSLTITSHAYVGLIIPCYIGIRALLEYELTFKDRIWRAFYTTALFMAMSAWSVIPMVLNNPWTTPLPMTWIFSDWKTQLLPQIVYPIGCVLDVILVILICSKKLRRLLAPSSRGLLSLLLISIVYGGLYFVMPRLGLVDVRVIPQIYLFVAIVVGALLGTILLVLPAELSTLAVFLVCGLSIYWTNLHVDRFPMWSKWNYAGWYQKEVFPQLYQIYQKLKGDYSQPRVAWEHAAINDKGGSLRVFEMLPYFTGRSTLESLYTQSTIEAPMVYYLQSLISQHPSCPFRQYKCGKFNLTDAEDKLRLLGASELILAEKQSIDAAAQNPYLKPVTKSGAWSLYSLENVKLVDVPNTRPYFLEEKRARGLEWKQAFYEWFLSYSRGTPYVIALAKRDEPFVDEFRANLEKHSPSGEECSPVLKSDYNKIEIVTPCPGRFHLIKFAFHPNWFADSGEHLFNTSPGMIGVIPKDHNLVLRFKPSLLWKISNVVSVLTFIGAVVFWIVYSKRRTTKKEQLSS